MVARRSAAAIGRIGKNRRATVAKWIKYPLYYSSLRRKAVHLGAISKKSRRGRRSGNVRLITNSAGNPPFSPAPVFLPRFPVSSLTPPSSPSPSLPLRAPFRFFRRFFAPSSGSSLTIASWLLFSSHHRRYYLLLLQPRQENPSLLLHPAGERNIVNEVS